MAEDPKIEAKINELEVIDDVPMTPEEREAFEMVVKENPVILQTDKNGDPPYRKRWIYRMDKRGYRLRKKLAELKAIENDNDLKAFKNQNTTEIIKLVIYCVFTAFMAFAAPEFVPKLIKAFFFSGT